MLEEFIKTLLTGNGFWNPLVWILGFIVIFLVVYILRGYGNATYKKGTSQTQSFLSGNPEYEKQFMHVKASNLYWGWTNAMKWIIDILKKMHTGNVSDYVLWFVIVLGVLFIFVGLM